MTFSAFTTEEEPRDNWDVVVPFELFFAMHTNGTPRVAMRIAFFPVHSAHLAAKKGAKDGADDKHKDKK